jgi:hypothetical protein
MLLDYSVTDLGGLYPVVWCLTLAEAEKRY